ncbi:GNAT family N-acetyltransferase [Clostridium manihotivorum]|uniref:GNAT family N-acetyltransferase n=1 Tax=Clostridium manihotivorum TaxID=2320868 RepID=A0A3R5QV81_9CLOT|nr:GNAT family protein [Clostridium manihotivorum]QAA30243.1 GNAT family N-acetyltransferase [Clostridium manihotivorum]
MAEKKTISIELIRGTDKDYIIKDYSGITIGRFNVIEFEPENQRATIRFKFYRNDNYQMMKKALEKCLENIFKGNKIYKVNVLANESSNVSAFFDLGFILEGILSNNLVQNDCHKSELLFGINLNDFRNFQNITILKLKGRRIELRNLTPEHTSQLLEFYIRNEKHLKTFEPARDKSFYTYDTQLSILLESYKQFMNGSSIDFGIFLNSELIGKIKLSNIVLGVFKSGILGYSMDEKHCGLGYMKEAVNLLIDYCFNDMGLHRLEASTLVDNLKSQNVLLKCGFKKIGLNEKYLFINGEWRDHITFCKINDI